MRDHPRSCDILGGRTAQGDPVDRPAVVQVFLDMKLIGIGNNDPFAGRNNELSFQILKKKGGE